MPRRPPTGWYVELEHSSGAVHQPDVLDDLSLEPAVRELPTIELPVRRGSKWQSSGFERQRLEVWRDGQVLPIEQLGGVGERQARRGTQTLLEGVGGVDLRQRVEREIGTKETHLIVEDLISNETGLVANVDTPDVTEQTQTVLDPSAATEWSDVLADTDLSTLPVTVDTSTDELALQQSMFTQEGENAAAESGTQFAEDSAYSGDSTTSGAGAALEIASVGDYIEWTFDLDYTIPEEDVSLHVREDASSGDPMPEITWSIDGNTTYVMVEGQITGGPNWFDRNDTDQSGNTYTGGDLTPGTHTLRAEVTSSTAGWYAVDVVAPGDGRWDYDYDTSVTTAGDGSNYLDGPQLYPGALDVPLDRQVTVLSVVEGDLTSTWDDTSNGQQVAMRNQSGGSWSTASNTTSLSTSFANRGSLLDARLTLSRYGSQTNTPGTGINGQRVADLTVDVTADDMPLTIDRTFDDTILSICQTLAEEANAVFGVDVDASGGLTFEWTQLGQRRGSAIEDVETIDASTDYDIVEKAVVYGGGQQVRREPATADVGTAVELSKARLKERSETVRSAADGTEYVRGDDYTIAWQDGTITALSGGTISDGESLEVDYEFKPRNSYTADGAGSDPREIVERIPELSSERACGLAAYRIVEEASEPLHEATVQLPKETEANVVEALEVEALPQDVPLETRAVESTPVGTVLTLGSRQRVQDVVQDIRSRIRGVAEQT